MRTRNEIERVSFGRTDLRVCPIGIGCGSGISSADVLHAFDRGVNFFFYSSDLHPQAYGPAREALRELCGSGSRRRGEVVLAACSYMCDAEKIPSVVVDQMQQLDVDYVDIFLWGWVTRQSRPRELLSDSARMLDDRSATDIIARAMGVAREVGDELHARGYARYLGFSTHDRSIAREFAADPGVDALMLRYNAAHRGAERDIFPHLPATARPGVIAFNTSHTPTVSLAQPPAGLGETKYRPTHGDYYRYVADRPEVDVVLTGPSTRAEIDHALDVYAQGPLEPRLRAYLEQLGDVHAGRGRLTG